MIKRIPVYLLTGFLGAGKTTLLASWLLQPELKDAAVVVNEIGEVGLDHRLLSSAAGTRSLLANACICCTGLPGLEEALEDLFWARLHRRVPAFSSVVIETTGLADPGPVIASLQGENLLRERYHLAGVITMLDAAAGHSLLRQFEQARAQVASADLVVMTKTDQAEASTVLELRSEIQGLNRRAKIAESRRASLRVAEAQALLMACSLAAAAARAVPNAMTHGSVESAGQDVALRAGHHRHVHDAESGFLAMPQALELPALEEFLQRVIRQLGPRLLRLKGEVPVADGACVVVQVAPGDQLVQISAMPEGTPATEPERFGVTVVVQGVMDAAVWDVLNRSLQSAQGNA